jgi:ribose-phosphate pyrophosphokinase
VVSGDALIGDVAERDLVILDDMIVSGGTIARAARAARAAGARKIVVAAAHAPLMAEARQLLENGGPDAILVSDSVALPKPFAGHDRFRVCSCADALATTIRHLTSRS